MNGEMMTFRSQCTHISGYLTASKSLPIACVYQQEIAMQFQLAQPNQASQQHRPVIDSLGANPRDFLQGNLNYVFLDST